MYDALQPIVKFNEVSGNIFEKSQLTDDLPQFYKEMVKEEYKEMMVKGFEAGNLTEVVDGAGDLVVVACGVLFALGVHPNDVLIEINRSNMSKFCETLEDAEASVAAYDGDARYQDVFQEKVGNYYVIRGRVVLDDGSLGGWKILKGIHFSKPDFSKLLEGHPALNKGIENTTEDDAN